MKMGSAIAIYFIIWWTLWLVALPFGVRNAHEMNEAVEEGNEPGAPVRPLLMRKAIATSFASLLVLMFYYWVRSL